MTNHRAVTAETMLETSQHVRDELMAAVGRLDSYIDQLRQTLPARGERSEEASDGSATP